MYDLVPGEFPEERHLIGCTGEIKPDKAVRFVKGAHVMGLEGL